MKYIEYGEQNREVVVLLHGGGLSWWNYRETAEILQDEYHIILPILDGHAGSDRPFTSIEDNAVEIISWIDAHCGGAASLIGGLSLGGQILLEMLSRRRNLCAHALVESAAAIPSRLTNALIAPAFGCGYGLIRNRGFAKLQFQSLHVQPALFEAYYRDTCQIKKSDMIAFMEASTGYALKDTIRSSQAKVRVYYGGKEPNEIKRSAKLIGKMLPACQLHCFPNAYHGAFSLNQAQNYADTIRQMLGGGQ